MGIRTTTSTVTAATSFDLVPLAQVKDDLVIKASADDAFLRRTITRESLSAAQYCNRTLVVETVTDTIDLERDAFPYQVPGGVRELQLSRWPVVSLTSLSEDGTALTENTDFRVNYKTGQVYRLSTDSKYVVDWRALPVVVTYSAGYSPIPADMQDAVTRMVKARWLARKRDPMLKSETVDGIGSSDYWVGTSTTPNMSGDIVDILDNYRVPVAGL